MLPCTHLSIELRDGQSPRRLVALGGRATVSFFVFWAAVIAQASLSHAQQSSPEASATDAQSLELQGLETQHTFWEVSSRCLAACGPRQNNCQLPKFSVTRCVDGFWKPSSVDELLTHNNATPEQRVVIYVHGNWMTHPNARGRARVVYANLLKYATEPITFIAFSWPSEQQRGFARDVFAKKDRTEIDAYYLALLLSNLQSEQSVGILGFSFGGRVVAAALHMVGGGTVAGRNICECPTDLCFRLSLYAPAFDRTALSASGAYCRALIRVESTVNLYNSADPVLRRFKYIDRSSKPIAAGFAGILGAATLRPDTGDATRLVDTPRIVQYDCCNIGRTHYELDYQRCPAMPIALKNVLGL